MRSTHTTAFEMGGQKGRQFPGRFPWGAIKYSNKYLFDEERQQIYAKLRAQISLKIELWSILCSIIYIVKVLFHE